MSYYVVISFSHDPEKLKLNVSLDEIVKVKKAVVNTRICRRKRIESIARSFCLSQI